MTKKKKKKKKRKENHFEFFCDSGLDGQVAASGVDRTDGRKTAKFGQRRRERRKTFTPQKLKIF
jgi:hypothetical protein